MNTPIDTAPDTSPDTDPNRPLESLHAGLTLSLSDFKRNPSAAVRAARGRTLAVLNHNRVSFYVVSPGEFGRLIGQADLATGTLAATLAATSSSTQAGHPANPREPPRPDGLLRQVETQRHETPENPAS